jgi:hypothetical protein
MQVFHFPQIFMIYNGTCKYTRYLLPNSFWWQTICLWLSDYSPHEANNLSSMVVILKQLIDVKTIANTPLNFDPLIPT